VDEIKSWEPPVAEVTSCGIPPVEMGEAGGSAGGAATGAITGAGIFGFGTFGLRNPIR
jgi:hypothetical protein